MGLFDKKYCDVCGEKIGLLGNRKLEDGNLCKNCAKKLSPWFEERRHSTVDEIKQQLQYREDNRTRAAQFSASRTMGDSTKVLINETHRWLTVTSARNLAEANPDILDYQCVTGCRMDIDENRTELKHDGPDGKQVSYNPPRYRHNYNFYIIINVNTPYFDEMRFRLNTGSIEVEQGVSTGVGGSFGRLLNNLASSGFDPMNDASYRNYYEMAQEICEVVKNLRNESAPAPSAPAAAPVGPWHCPACGAENNGKFCESCGTRRPQ